MKARPAIATLLLFAAEPARPSADKVRYDLVYSTEVVTPHVPWATKLPGGPVKGFFIPSISTAGTWSS